MKETLKRVNQLAEAVSKFNDENAFRMAELQFKKIMNSDTITVGVYELDKDLTAKCCEYLYDEWDRSEINKVLGL